jgi:prepilin peptidase CpaA
MFWLITLASLSVIYTDITSRVISNKQVVLLILLTCTWAIHHIGLAGLFITLGVSTLIAIHLFAAKIWAGGDAKLFIALAPLFTLSQLPVWIFSILIFSSAITIFYVVKLKVTQQSIKGFGLPFAIPIVMGSGLSFYINLFAVVSK